MLKANGQDAALASALSSGNKLELHFLEAGPNVDIVYKKKDVSVYKMVR